MDAPQDDRVAAIAAELGRLGRRLDALAAELSAWQPPVAPRPGGPGIDGPQPASTVAAPPHAGVVRHRPRRTVARHARSGMAGRARRAVAPPNPGGHYPDTRQPFPPAPLPPPAPRRPLRAWLASLSGARLLAWTGAGVTLLGVVLLLALAAARGWFAPPVRVAAGAVLGLALVGLGARLHRRPSSRTGALAVTGTGIATLYLVVAAATALYGYLPVPAGLFLALLVAAGGLALADRWKAVLLGCGAVVGAALLAPVVTERLSPLLVGLVLVLQVAATVVALRRRWPVLAGIAAGWPVLYGTLVAGLAEPADRWGVQRPRSPCWSWASRRRRGPSGRSRCRAGCGSAWWSPRPCRR